MTINQLIGILSKYDGDREVVLANDAEGNSFSPLDELDSSNYVPETSYAGYIVGDDDLEDWDDDERADVVEAVVLWPVN